jgi:hypothetical protein
MSGEDESVDMLVVSYDQAETGTQFTIKWHHLPNNIGTFPALIASVLKKGIDTYEKLGMIDPNKREQFEAAILQDIEQGFLDIQFENE